jgi:hypothetical protein
MRIRPLAKWIIAAFKETFGIVPAPYEVDQANYWGKKGSAWYDHHGFPEKDPYGFYKDN